MAKILIVDDDKKIIRMLMRRLKKAGYEVDYADNGKAGIEKAQTLLPEIILMDMYMPVMNGYEATQTLRQDGYTGIIVALTASAMAHQVNKSLQAGCDYFIPKPIELNFENQLQDILKEGYGKNSDCGR